MGKTAVWSDMVGNVMVDTTGTKDVPPKSTGNEKVKASVCLLAKADGPKLKPFNHPENGWINKVLVLKFFRQVLRVFYIYSLGTTLRPT